MTEVSGGPDEVWTIIFPKMVRIVNNELFYEIKTLRSVILNEGLEVLGTDEYQADGDLHKGVFEKSGLTKIWLPSTLKRIEYSVFKTCTNLRSIRLPGGLEYVGKVAFSETGLRGVEFPRSV